MDQQNLGDYIEVDVVFINYKENLPKFKPTIELEEISIIDAENCDSKCLQTNFRDTKEGKSLSALFNWYVKRMKNMVKIFPKKPLRVAHWGVKSGDVNVFSFSGEFYTDLAYTYDRKTDYWFGTKMDGETKQLILEYICSTKSSSKSSKVRAQVAAEKKSKKKHETVLELHEETHYSPKCRTALQFGESGRHSRCSSSSSSSDVAGEATLLDLDATDQVPEQSNHDLGEQSKMTSLTTSPRVYQYFSESPCEMYKAFSQFLRTNSSSDEEETASTYISFDYCNFQESQLRQDEENPCSTFCQEDEKY